MVLCRGNSSFLSEGVRHYVAILPLQPDSRMTGDTA
jgi:hypothetical protein